MILTGNNACKASWVEGRCTCCGSISVTDAIKNLKTPGTRYTGTDWKYGWPHKFYICPPNPDAAKLVEIGREYNVQPGDPDTVSDTFGRYKPIMGTQSLIHCKFYATHILDASPDELKEFNDLSVRYFGLHWFRDTKGLGWTSPQANHQKFGIIP